MLPCNETATANSYAQRCIAAHRTTPKAADRIPPVYKPPNRTLQRLTTSTTAPAGPHLER